MPYPNKARKVGRITIRRPVRRLVNRRPMIRKQALSRNLQRRRMRNNVKSTIFQLSEKKYSPCTSYNEAPGVAIQVGAKATMWLGVLGAVPSAWSSDFNPLGGIEIQDINATGAPPSSQTRVGEYVQLQHTSLFMNLDMKFNNTDAPPCEFRVIHFRQRRQAMPAGINPNPAVSLFLGITGKPFGHASADAGTTGTGVNGTDLMAQPLNKRDWIIYKDQKLVLTKPSKEDKVGSNGTLSCFRNFRYRFNFNKKTRYGPANVPENVAYHHGIAIYCRGIDKDQNTTLWEVNTRGTTTFCDF